MSGKYIFDVVTTGMRVNLHTRQIRIYFPSYNMVGLMDENILLGDIIEDGINYILNYTKNHIFQYPIVLIVQHPDENGKWLEEKRIKSYELRNIILQLKNGE